MQICFQNRFLVHSEAKGNLFIIDRRPLVSMICHNKMPSTLMELRELTTHKNDDLECGDTKEAVVKEINMPADLLLW